MSGVGDITVILEPGGSEAAQSTATYSEMSQKTKMKQYETRDTVVDSDDDHPAAGAM